MGALLDARAYIAANDVLRTDDVADTTADRAANNVAYADDGSPNTTAVSDAHVNPDGRANAGADRAPNGLAASDVIADIIADARSDDDARANTCAPSRVRL